MNILPKKRWHVRTKENIARVRRDEKRAEEELKEVERRAKLAEQEARTKMLRERARDRMGGLLAGSQEARDLADRKEVSITTAAGHVNLFEDLEAGETTHAENKEAAAEKKAEQEEYEKKIGLLTYLGQDTNELTGDKSWWERLPEDRKKKAEEDKEEQKASGSKAKDVHDPLNDLRKYLGCDGIKKYLKKAKPAPVVEDAKANDLKKKAKKRKRSSSSSSGSSSDDDRKRRKSKKRKKEKRSKRKKSKKKKKSKHKKHKKRRSSSSSSESSESEEDVDLEAERKAAEEKRQRLERLRAERLDRERKERARERRLITGEPDPQVVAAEAKRKMEEEREKKQKYSTQFNPQAARQNKLDSNRKYWLE